MMARAVAVMARTAGVIAWRGRWQVTARAVAVMVRAVAGDGEGGAGDGEDGPWQNPGQHTQRGKIPSLVAHQRHPPIGLPLLVVLENEIVQLLHYSRVAPDLGSG